MSDKGRTSPYIINKISSKNVARIKNNINYEIMADNLRIKNKILEVKGLRPQTQGNTGYTPTKKKIFCQKDWISVSILATAQLLG